MIEWLTASEIQALGIRSLPTSMSQLQAALSAWRDDPTRARFEPGRGREGGCWRYHVSLLPVEARAKLLAAELGGDAETSVARSQAVAASLWDRFEKLSDKAKAEAARRLAIVVQVDMLAAGVTRQTAVALAAREAGISTSTLWSWIRQADEVAVQDRLPALAPRRVGRTTTAEMSAEAWDFIKADWLRPEAPNFDACYRRVSAAAATNGWAIPSAKTVKRRIERELPRTLQILARDGREAAKAVFPHQLRDRSMFHAMQAVNADGHKFDVFAKWPDGSIGRPLMVAIQDLYSGMIVGHRIGASENWTLVRHAFADMVESFGIPEQATLDNGRSFASKWLTGGASTRYRFKIRDDEPAGLLTSLGVQIHWATPYHGQAKPIERAFRDMCEDIAKDPRFAGAYTGNTVDAKPENYGAKAIPIDVFRAIVAEGIAAHNRRPGRRSQVAAGRSFAEAFDASYRDAMVRRATEAQRRLLLLAAEGVTARKPTGEIWLGDNRYWAEPLAQLAGRKVVVRFDPDDLFDPVAVYSLDGRYLCQAECIEMAGFSDMAAAQEHARRKRAWFRAQREMLAIERRMTIDQVAGLLPAPAPYEAPETKVVKLAAAGGRGPARSETWEGAEAFSAAMRLIEGGQIVPFERP